MTRRLHAAFSMVELLVVIGIISILAALIIPVLGRAKDQSNVIVCRSNQRNLLMKCLLYAHDHDHLLPVDRQLHNPHGGLIEKLSDDVVTSDSKVYYCPSERSDGLKHTDENFDNGDIGYFYYCFSGRPNEPALSSFYLKNLPWPRLLKDTDHGRKWVFSDSWFSGMPTAHRWYKKGVNYVTLDGSAHMVNESPRTEFK